MLEQRNLTRERERDCFWLMWNSFTNQASNEIWFAMAVVMKILSFNIYKAMEQKPTMRATKSGLQWQLKWKANQASNEIWFAMAVEMKILSFNIYKAMEQKPFARSNRNVQIDQNSNLTI